MHTIICNNKRKKQRVTAYGEELVMAPDLVEFERLLKKHDWTYNYSDDHRAWQNGRMESDEIRRQREILCGLGMDHLADEMYKKYCKMP